MKLLINMNLPRSLTGRLDEKGHECRHVGDIGMASADDTEIVELARQTGETILTHDLDYGHILAFSGYSYPSVVIFRLRKMSVDNIVNQLTLVWQQVSDALAKGAVVTVSELTVRVRHLPIGR